MTLTKSESAKYFSGELLLFSFKMCSRSHCHRNNMGSQNEINLIRFEHTQHKLD